MPVKGAKEKKTHIRIKRNKKTEPQVHRRRNLYTPENQTNLVQHSQTKKVPKTHRISQMKPMFPS